ncbi:MAG: RNA 2',3'-cyclic phosphodiesterase [Pirellulaceae bacterium]|nr:RNA 2',3'-cyclic phosphodiesterase [Pirellulaceae bacterium]
MGQTIRTFVAIEIDDAVRSAAVELIDQLRTSGADVKWVEADNLHLTVQFLGEVTLTDTANICQSLSRAAAEVEPFELAMGGAGAFPTAARPKTVWLGSRGDDRPMLELHKQVEKRLQKLGFRPEARRYQPHLTLGRVKKAGPELKTLGEMLAQRAEYPAGTTWVEELVLFSSQLTSDGPIYEPLGRAKLGNR